MFRILIDTHFAGCVVVLTGPIDHISDGTTVVSLHNGHEMLGRITGSGCMVGSSIATYCAAAVPAQSKEELDDVLVPRNMLLGAVAG